jgi:transcriptional regulator with XRE-family HTH domain
MVADSDQPSLPARRLAERLRDLREHEPLTQRQLATVIGGADALSVATISQWENPNSGRLPPPPRLAAYSRLFCTDRSFASGTPHLLRDDDLTEQERQREGELYAELLALRERAPAAPAVVEPRSSFWQFADGAAVSIVCSDAPEPPEYAKSSHLNYSRYSRYADLDALIEVFGQVKAENPASMVRILPTESLEYDFALNHLVIIGGEAGRDTTSWFAKDITLPVAEEKDDSWVFHCTVDGEMREFGSENPKNRSLLEDVGLVARGPHPNVPDRTVTILGGITSRGVHGAALCFTDGHVKDANEQYLSAAFGNSDAFCILMRVPVRRAAALPPNLSDPDIRLYEWSPQRGARW